jgi:predicted metalloprotease
MFAKVKLAAAVASASLAVGATAVEEASALTPAQRTEAGVVNLLGGYTSDSAGSIDDFWRRTLAAWGKGYAKPGLKYYGNGAGGYYGTACGSTYPVRGENGMYCPADQTIYLDYWGQQGLLDRLGDFGAGGFLAHEWAHRAQHYLGYLVGNFRQEYNADCMAGLYTRFAYNMGRAQGGDFWEFSNWLYYQPASPSHGTGPNRASWFRHGYTQYSKGACDQAFSLTVSGAEGRSRSRSTSTRFDVRPPKRAAVDLTPRASKALPKGHVSRGIAPRRTKVDLTKPVV